MPSQSRLRKSVQLGILGLSAILALNLRAEDDQGIRLKKLNIDQSQVTVSGVSSGGFMAVQMHLAHSNLISGAASVAGGIYWCAEGQKAKSFGQCMLYPGKIHVDRYIKHAEHEAKERKIDSLDNLRDDRVYIFASREDHVVRATAGEKLRDFYRALMPSESVVFHEDGKAAHGFPTLNYGEPCQTGGPPWLLDCGFDTAGEILSNLYRSLNAPTDAVQGHLRQFDQTEFAERGARLATHGSVYVPEACERGEECRLHIAFHGCQMNEAAAANGFTFYGGYNRWAEANQIVVLYPNATDTLDNPSGCWDWFGLTNDNYANKNGTQIRSLKAMIDRVVGL